MEAEILQSLALVARFSYVDNPSRRPISMEQNTTGEHQFFVGIEVVFGSGLHN